MTPRHGNPLTPASESRRTANRMLLGALSAAWDRVPEQRFGQFVMNLSRTEDGFADTWEWLNSDWHRRIEEAVATWAREVE